MSEDKADEVVGATSGTPATNPLDVGDNVPLIYGNGFTIAYGNADIVLRLDRNGKPVGLINMSFTLAKSLAQSLGSMVQDIESKADFEIKTTKEIDLSAGKE